MESDRYGKSLQEGFDTFLGRIEPLSSEQVPNKNLSVDSSYSLRKVKEAKSSKIQELFDCDVLKLDKSPLKIVDDVEVEEILNSYNSHSKIEKNIEKLKDWYSIEVGQLPIEIARLICQRSNCRWDSSLRTLYSDFLKYAM